MYRRVHASGSQSLLHNYSTSPIRAMEGNMVLVIQAIKPLHAATAMVTECWWAMLCYVYEMANVTYARIEMCTV